ncbi:MAG: undecaprenyldiphospho-muramoylpentapeptide beta-N-acetylglucosaminyltransferase [Chlorobi bacterium]|nr:undecaprenyldiphospho-muramoylpentapeptide beta-N-acetylglucosaminyltransferase [Chlorobiota bacterium]
MNKKVGTYSFLISGGGTGGHIFPALSIARELEKQTGGARIHFVGARGRMEMEKVPQAGYEITGLPIAGLQRKKWWKNLALPFKVMGSLWGSYRLLKRFCPDAVIGTGGYASLPLLWTAQRMGIPTYIQEQNSYPGISNKILGRKARKIFTAYDEAAAFFDKNKIVKTGNPVREDIRAERQASQEDYSGFGLQADKPVIFITGGSLGSAAINRRIAKWVEEGLPENLQLLWQTGKLYYDRYRSLESDKVRIMPFIKDMNKAYTVADIIVSRAGAGTLSELALVGKPVILIPSPNVAEDHQTKNARAFERQQAAILLPEKDLEALPKRIAELIADKELRQRLSENLAKAARPGATARIVETILNDLKQA